MWTQPAKNSATVIKTRPRRLFGKLILLYFCSILSIQFIEVAFVVDAINGYMTSLFVYCFYVYGSVREYCKAFFFVVVRAEGQDVDAVIDIYRVVSIGEYKEFIVLVIV